MFTWIVEKINLSISNNINFKSMKPGEKPPVTKFIGILDIFGFEIF